MYQNIKTMENKDVIKLLTDEFKSIEKKQKKIKRIADRQERTTYPTEQDTIYKLEMQKMILIKMLRKIQKSTT